MRRRHQEGAPTSPALGGVPQQIFDLTAAPKASAIVAPSLIAHAVVRSDQCVGCGCVAACPEPGALRLEGKS
ncbi:MAG: hypothetical protein U0527_06540 [Candidatus Eisenbacteria bacterium]